MPPLNPDPSPFEAPILQRRPDRVAAYPRPPALVPCALPVRVEVFGGLLAETDQSLWVLETFHPPTIYLPPASLRQEWLQPAAGRSFCEWKGVARYWDLVDPAAGRRLQRAVWGYPAPTERFAPLAGWYSLYPGLMDGCWVDGAAVEAQPGGFYGGWILPWLLGPFKGDPAHPELV